MSADHCGATEHRFAKFDDATIFCQRCGEQRVMDVQALIAKLPVPTYLPCPGPHVYTYPPYTVPWTPWWGTTTITYLDSGSTSVDMTGSGSSTGMVLT